MSATKNEQAGAQADYRIKEGGPWSNAWKVAAAAGALGIAGAGAGFVTDGTRFAFSYLFAFYCFLTIALGSLFFVLIQHLTGAGWSVSVRRTAEFFMSGLWVFALLVLPVLASARALYPWLSQGPHGPHGTSGGHDDASAEPAKHGALGLPALERVAHAEEKPSTLMEGPRLKPGPAGETEPATIAKPPVDSEPKAIAPNPAEPSKPHGARPGHGPGRHEVDHAQLEKALEDAEAREHAELMAGKSAYLNAPFFYARAVFYVLVWALVSGFYFKVSTEQDTSKKLENTAKAQRFAPVATILMGLTLTFAGVDWLMSLDPAWFSTIWGVYLFSCGVVAMFATVILTTLSLRRAGLLGDTVTVEHYHDLGKLQFGFLVFWAYIAFSQFFLIWYSNIPEELTFFHRRWSEGGGSWQPLGWAIIVLHFAVPFLVLLSRNTKRRLPVLAFGAALILLMHFVEMYWIVMPNFGSGVLRLHWLDAACLLAVGGVYLAVVFRRMTAHALIPIGDPRLARALHHEN